MKFAVDGNSITKPLLRCIVRTMAIRRKRRVNAIEEGKESARCRGWRKGSRANEEVGGSGAAREKETETVRVV